uniref:Uncharacterized protein n=1 Tax=Plectus sambesii TaxID=2011161 RepID=A0A914W0S4_9BILA
MLPNKAESSVSKVDQKSVDEGVKNLDEAEYRNLLENATQPTYVSSLKKDANSNEAVLANGVAPLSSTTSDYLTALRKEADASQTAADAESERAHGALFDMSSSHINARSKLSKCASQDSTMCDMRSGSLHTRTRSGPAVGVDEQIDVFGQAKARNAAEVRIAIPEPDLPFIDHDQEDLHQQQDQRAWQRLVNGQQPASKKVKNVEPANQEVELQPLLDSHQGSPVADDDKDSNGELAAHGRFQQRGKCGSYDVSNNIVNDYGYPKSNETQPFYEQNKFSSQPQYVPSNRLGGLHSPPTERDMTVSGRGGTHYGTNRSQTQRGVRPARADINQRKKYRDANVKEVFQSDEIPGHMGDLPLDELVTLIEGPKPTGGKKKGSLPDTTAPTGAGKKSSSRSGDSSQSLDEQALEASDDADGEDSEETEQWVSADENARPSYSAIAGRPRRPPTASFGDFIDDSAMKRTARNAASLQTSRCGSPDHHAHGHTGRQTAAASNQANASSPDLFSYRTAPSHGHHHGAMAKALLSPPLPPSMHKADGLELEDPPLSVEASLPLVAPVSQGPSWADIAKSSRSPTCSSHQPSPSPRPSSSSDELRGSGNSAAVSSASAPAPSSTEVSLDATIVAAHQLQHASPSAANPPSSAALANDPDAAAAAAIPISSSSTTASVTATLDTPVASGQSTLCAVDEETIGELQDEQDHVGHHADDDGCGTRSVKGAAGTTGQRRDVRDSTTSFVILPGEESQQPQLDISFFYEPAAAGEHQQQQQQLLREDDREELENGERTPTGEDDYDGYDDDECERPATVTAVDGALRLSFGNRTLTFFEPSQPIVEIAKLPAHHSRMAVDVAKQWKDFVQGAAPTRYKDVSIRRQATATTGH